MTDKETMKLALEALKQMTKPRPSFELHKNAITAIKEALAEHAMRETQRLGQEIEQEPVAWMVVGNGEYGEYEIGRMLEKKTDPNFKYWEARGYELVPLYTHPPQRTEPTCPDCKAIVLYECVACSSNNYPPPQRKPLTYCQECMRPNPIDGTDCAHGIKENT